MIHAFLIADVRGYTHFTVEHGDEAAARLADRFAAMCEKTVIQHEGRVLELRGDEALCVFSSARQALRGAVALQQACKQAVAVDPSLPLAVGIGLDAGEAIPVRGGYRGGALNLAARLCSIAGADEVLASEGVVHLARTTDGLLFVDRGQVLLKGITAPVRVFQIAAEGELPEELPPLQQIPVSHPTNLPDDPTRFIGREGEIAAIAALMRDPHIRLVTLTGPGGTGKSRLAVQVGAMLLHEYRDGVFFVSLAALANPALVPSAIAEVLGAQGEVGKEPLETLAEYLGEKHLLLVLDNLEHLLESSSVVAHLLDACRGLHVLVTSRIPLHLSREHEYPVPPLSVPDAAHLPTAETLSQYDAVALFIERARAVRPSFYITNENAPAVAEICFRLDGLPLAIELAAARIRLLPPQTLLRRLSSRLQILTGGATDRPSRQQSMRNAIDWSYSLLTTEDQLLLARLSVFSGGYTFEAAEAVCNPEGTVDLLEGTASLLEQSLLRQQDGEELRFIMLETIGEYAAEKLAKCGEEAETRRRHAEHFLVLARSANLTIEAEGAMRHNLIIRDRDNFRAALEWACGTGEIELGLRLAVALENYWVTASNPHEGRRWLRELLEQAETLPVELRAHALRTSANTASAIGNLEESIRFYEQSLAEYRRLGDERGVGIVLQRLAVGLLKRGEAEQARAHIEESLSLHEKIGFKKGEAASLNILAGFARQDGNEGEAFALYQRSASLAEESGFVYLHAAVLFNVAKMLLARGRILEADTHIRRALALNVSMDDRAGTVYSLALLAWSAGEAGQPERAGRLWGAIEVEEARAPVGWTGEERAGYARPVLAHSGPEFERGREQGHRLSLIGGIEDALGSPEGPR